MQIKKPKRDIIKYKLFSLKVTSFWNIFYIFNTLLKNKLEAIPVKQATVKQTEVKRSTMTIITISTKQNINFNNNRTIETITTTKLTK